VVVNAGGDEEGVAGAELQDRVSSAHAVAPAKAGAQSGGHIDADYAPGEFDLDASLRWHDGRVS